MLVVFLVIHRIVSLLNDKESADDRRKDNKANSVTPTKTRERERERSGQPKWISNYEIM